MRILQVASEVHPYSKTGGLADMVGALSRALARKGHWIDIVTPAYRGIADRFPEIEPADWRFDLRVGPRLIHGEFLRHEVLPGLTVWFVRQPDFYDRPGIYNERQIDYPDNSERFIFFSKAALLLARYLTPSPTIIHCHDWQAALVPLLTRYARVSGSWNGVPANLLTIHNLAYQGWCPAKDWRFTNVPESWFHSDSAQVQGLMNFLKAGLHLADAITTVSPRYAREICTPEFGAGLDPLLRRRESQLRGILNGVDYSEWNTTDNPTLAHAYSVNSMGGKAANKAELQRELGLPVRPEAPIFANITRLTPQKGADLQLRALQMLEEEGASFQFVLLGSGDPDLETAYRRWADLHPQKVAVRLGFNPALAHRIEAGADFYLMPSRFEPCGLNQLYSLRYGTIPVVRATGGLDDSVVDLREDRDRATGIKFGEPTASALVHAMRKALGLFGEPDLLAHYRRNAMRADFSWERQSIEYVTLYQQLTQKS